MPASVGTTIAGSARLEPGTGLRILLPAAILSSLLVSPALLYALGINYASDAGSPLEKLHLSTLLCVLAFGLCALFDGRLRFSLITPRSFALLLAIVALAAAQLLVLRRPVTGLVVTFLTPVLLLYLLALADPALRRRIRALVAGVLLLNSLVGLAEFALGATLLPRVAGAVEIHGDTRALGLIGHPLTASFLTGIMLIYLVISRMMTRFDRWAVLQIAIHAMALLAFGGRLALLATVFLLAIYILFDGTALARRSPTARWLIRYAIALAGFLAGGVMLLSGLAAQMLARFAADGGSASTRWAAIDIVAHLDLDGLLFGLPPARRDAMLLAFGTPYGIEITWLAWLVDYGLFISLGLATVLALVLRACLCGATRVHVYMVAYFLICITGAQGLGAKSLLLAWLVILLLTFRRHSSPRRSAASSAPRPAPARLAQAAAARLRRR